MPINKKRAKKKTVKKPKAPGKNKAKIPKPVDVSTNKNPILLKLDIPSISSFRDDIIERETRCRELGHVKHFSSNTSGTYQQFWCDECEYSYYIDSSD